MSLRPKPKPGSSTPHAWLTRLVVLPLVIPSVATPSLLLLPKLALNPIEHQYLEPGELAKPESFQECLVSLHIHEPVFLEFTQIRLLFH